MGPVGRAWLRRAGAPARRLLRSPLLRGLAQGLGGTPLTRRLAQACTACRAASAS